ncbi:MAG: uncharacterized protein JWM78_909 [Verrucomicrobiaceae bacterium]|nr:uncharacterized protein [Verrucomicrobiaceae bacterium]
MRGSKDKYTDKQKREAAHIEKGYEQRGTNHHEAERRAWATVNKESGGGKKAGSGHAHAPKEAPTKSDADGHSTIAKRSAAAKKGWATRRAHAQ